MPLSLYSNFLYHIKNVTFLKTGQFLPSSRLNLLIKLQKSDYWEPKNHQSVSVTEFRKLEFQRPYGPFRNSSPCWGHACFPHMVSYFTQNLTLERRNAQQGGGVVLTIKEKKTQRNEISTCIVD